MRQLKGKPKENAKEKKERKEDQRYTVGIATTAGSGDTRANIAQSPPREREEENQ